MVLMCRVRANYGGRRLTVTKTMKSTKYKLETQVQFWTRISGFTGAQAIRSQILNYNPPPQNELLDCQMDVPRLSTARDIILSD